MLAHNYTGVNNVQNVLSATGRNVKIGVLDSGIDYNHPAFGSCFKTPGCRVQYGYDFVGDFFMGQNPVPDNDPYDPCLNHGTHVAGILAGNHGDFKGVAPDATIGMYRVMGCYNIVTEAIVIQALEQAYLDGMDIVTMSIGFPGSWGASASGDAAEALIKLGVFVVSAAGNRGQDGMWSIDGPSVRNTLVSFNSVGTITVSVGPDNIIFDSLTPRAPSAFSSWGPGPKSEVKPELLGPGSNIYAPWPLTLGSYGIISGTSMATPYVA
ncbi:peptidase S8/S53 domain-containing protein, partial [Dimargaris cristalligena]